MMTNQPVVRKAGGDYVEGGSDFGRTVGCGGRVELSRRYTERQDDNHRRQESK